VILDSVVGEAEAPPAPAVRPSLGEAAKDDRSPVALSMEEEATGATEERASSPRDMVRGGGM